MKIFYSSLLLLSSLQAVEFSISTDSNLSAPEKEVEMVVSEYARYGQQVNSTKIQHYIEDNRALANSYLHKHKPLSYAYKKTLEHKLEKILADDLIEEIKKSIEYEKEEVLYSYYLAKKDKQFMESELTSYTFIVFDSFEDANKAYLEVKNSPNTILTYAKEHNLTTETLTDVSLSQSYYSIKKLIKKDALPQLLPPQFMQKFTLVLITDVKKPKAKSYESVKQSIEDTLFSMKFKDIRKKTINDVTKKK